MKRSDPEAYERTILAGTAKRRRRPSIIPLVIFAQQRRSAAREPVQPVRELALLAPARSECAPAAPTRGVRIIDIA